jgi:hypothetical protein
MSTTGLSSWPPPPRNTLKNTAVLSSRSPEASTHSPNGPTPPSTAAPLAPHSRCRVQQRLGARQARHLEAHLHVGLHADGAAARVMIRSGRFVFAEHWAQPAASCLYLCRLYPGDLDVLSWLDHPVLESDRPASQSLHLLDWPLQQLLPAGV